MMRLYSLCLFIGALWLWGNPACAQSTSEFVTLGMKQGLSSNNVWSISQDKYGYMWISTENGLNRYDGHSIKQYFHSNGDKNSIAGNRIVWVFKDSDGDMWFACGYDGLSRYNYAKDNFEGLAPYDSARKHNKYTSPVWRFGEDAQKRIYLSCGAACYRYTKSTGKFEDLTPLFPQGWDAGIGRFFMQDNNIMWIATDAGMFRYDIAANKMRKIPFDVQKQGYGSEAMLDIEWVNKNELIIPMVKAGYVIMDVRTEKFRHADEPFFPGSSGKFSEVGEVMLDTKKRLWLAHTYSGLVKYAPGDNRSQFIKKDPLYPYPYAEQEGAGKTIFEDRDGNIWYGTSTQGVVYFQAGIDFLRIYQRDFSQTNSLPGNSVSCFYPGKNNTMWIGTYGAGLCRFDIAANRYTHYSPSIKENDQRPGLYLRTIVSSGNKIIFSSEKGLTALDESTGRFTTYGQGNKTNRPLPDISIRRMYELQPGLLMLVSHRVALFNTVTGDCTYENPLRENDPLFKLDKITSSSFDKTNGRLWLINNNETLYEYNTTSHSLVKKSGIPVDSANMLRIIHTDSKADLWLGFDKNIAYYDVATNKITRTIPVHSRVFNIASDEQWIWFTTGNEIGRISKTNWQVSQFNTNNLIPGISFWPKSLYKDGNGNFWLGSTSGFCLADPSKFKSESAVRSLSLTGFRVFDKTRNFDIPYHDVKEIELNYKDNFFSFTFSSFNFSDNRSASYSYKLEPFDKEWKLSNEAPASYTNVPPGDYKLLVRPASVNEKETIQPKEYIIRIKPPFWKTNWFYTGIALLAGIVVLWLWRLRKKAVSRNRVDATIDYFANSVYGENSVNEICWDIARNCISQLQFEDCVVYLMDEEKNVLVQKAAFGPKNPKGHDIVNPISIEPGQGIVGTVAASGKLLLIEDTTKDQRYIVDDEQRFSELAVPILHNDKVIGVIDSENSRKHFYTAEHVKAMVTIASISGNKIAEAQAREYARENEIKLLEIKKMLAESQLMALRAQMNPHFVFNCLNSIQECIVTNKYKEATTYLNKFSKLFRMVLNNSGKNLVTLEEEKNVLELYLELEYMRFENKFSYTIFMDEELESEEILIPSMLLQPYVENALWHGLMHKDGDRSLAIRFEKIDDDIFRCSIDDNGIGRQRSFELKEKQSKTKRHESKGLSISSDRLDVLNKQGYHAKLNITDKINEAGEPAGTLVSIELSTFLKN